MTFSQFMPGEFVNSHFLSSLEFFHFMDISDASTSKYFFSLSQVFVKSGLLSSRFFIPTIYGISHRTSFFSPSPSLPAAWFSFSGLLPAFPHSLSKQFLLSCCTPGTFLPDALALFPSFSDRQLQALLLHLSLQLLQNLFRHLHRLLVPPIYRGCDVIHKTPQFQRRVILVTSSPH